MFKRIAFSGVVGLLISATAAFANDYDAVADFPTTPTLSNVHNGVWSYGTATTLSPVDFSLDTTATANYFGDGMPMVFIRRLASTNFRLSFKILRTVTSMKVPLKIGRLISF